MQLSIAVRPISAVKAHLTEIIRTFSEEAAPPVVITHNGKAKAVLMGIHEYERNQETLAILKALSLSCKSFAAGNGRSAREVFAGMRAVEERWPFPLGRTPVSLARLRGEQGLYLYTWTAANAEQVIADPILGKREQATLALESFPLCSNVPSELEIVDITRYREIHAQTWRKIYEVLEAVVHAH